MNGTSSCKMLFPQRMDYLTDRAPTGQGCTIEWSLEVVSILRSTGVPPVKSHRRDACATRMAAMPISIELDALLSGRLRDVEARLQAACARAKRSRTEVTLV